MAGRTHTARLRRGLVRAMRLMGLLLLSLLGPTWGVGLVGNIVHVFCFSQGVRVTFGGRARRVGKCGPPLDPSSASG